jgi:hypothetical protein
LLLQTCVLRISAEPRSAVVAGFLTAFDLIARLGAIFGW